jgi:hypothetical protein
MKETNTSLETVDPVCRVACCQQTEIIGKDRLYIGGGGGGGGGRGEGTLLQTCLGPPIVSRALLRPPPLDALMPYFSRYVQSAWLGRG